MTYENNITKKCSLEHNDSISTYKGWGAQQNFNAFEVFHNFIRDVKPKRILEIGTSLGGFTSFLKYTCNKMQIPCDILTYDIHEKSWYKDLTDMGIDVRIENIFSNEYQTLSQEVIDFIRLDGTTIVLCDGGDKVREFNILSDYLKKGDFILGHDYAVNRDVFEESINKKIWNWHELSESDIKNACDRNLLEDYNRTTFESVVWVCKIKS
jgi:predicted O-methyltransferase YrrM